jgi:hypothetical protein
MLIFPVAGSKMAASAKACWLPMAMEHGGCRRYGVASTLAERRLLGTVMKQSATLALSAVVEDASAADEVEATVALAALVSEWAIDFVDECVVL